MMRGDASGAAEGVGLGLFIVRAIAREHGGTATARSSAAEGTAVTVVLPAGQASAELPS
jgi:signal transduction histidine kinase